MQHEYNLKNARALFKFMDARVGDLGVLISDEVRSERVGHASRTTLARMLEDGKMPETESKAVRDAFEVLQDTIEDLKMRMIVSLEMQEFDK